jgi:hypothetical protein
MHILNHTIRKPFLIQPSYLENASLSEAVGVMQLEGQSLLDIY